MIEESAKVVAIDGDSVTVESAIKSTCSSCQAQSECGTGVISRALAPKMQRLTLSTPMTVAVGQTVTIGVPEAGVLSASAWIYLLPLFIFIACFSLASYVLPHVGLSHELWGILPSAIVTVSVYRYVAKKLQRVDSAKYQPVLLEAIPLKRD
ncbi:SoxR reducing system RseC family protein [Alteromonas sp. A081]|uniref:SoxR reducing system RseC family protein n=1 Tax=Alteromonas sp. A081 TaxID=3410269 RepID=UPI003B985801